MRTLRRTGLVVMAVTLAAGCSGAVELKQERAIAAVAPSTTAPLPSTTATSARPGAAPGTVGLTPTGIVVPILRAAGGGWVVGTPCGGTATVRSVRPLTGTVVLDAGHGGRETGAVGPLGNKESDLNQAVVGYAEAALAAAGIPAVLTRTADYRVAITARAAIVGAVKPKAAVSVHHNASSSHEQETPGTEVFHQAVGTSAAESRRLAGLLYEEVTRTLAKLDVTGWAATPRAGTKPRRNAAGDDFYGILRRTQGTPTALLEVGFVSNEEEERRYADPATQKAVGRAVARGVVRFLTTADPGRGFVTPPQLADDGPQGGGSANCQDPPLG